MVKVIADFIHDCSKKYIRPIIKGKTDADKEKRKEVTKAYYEALYNGLKVLPKPVFVELETRAKEFQQSNGIKPYTSLENFFIRHITAKVGTTYKKFDGTEGIATGITSDELADRFAVVFCGTSGNTPESNALQTYVTAHLVANGKIAIRSAGIGKVAYTLPSAVAVKKSIPATELDFQE